jgi:hypothetical protein
MSPYFVLPSDSEASLTHLIISVVVRNFLFDNWRPLGLRLGETPGTYTKTFLIQLQNSLLTKDKRVIIKSRKIKVLKGGAYEQGRVSEAHG